MATVSLTGGSVPCSREPIRAVIGSSEEPNGLTVANLNAPVVDSSRRTIPYPGSSPKHYLKSGSPISGSPLGHGGGVGIDLPTGAVHPENATVDSVVLAGGLSWTQVDKALPMPVEVDDEALSASALRLHR
jgi:hypothetical protein